MSPLASFPFLCRSRRAAAGAVALCLAALAAPAAADEAWSSARGPVFWDVSIGDMAVLRLDDERTGAVVRIYVPGLARDMLGGRGSYRGFWLADRGEEDEDCPAQMVAPDGMKSHYWGRVTLTFVRPGFPSAWAGVTGTCFEEPATPLSGDLP